MKSFLVACSISLIILNAHVQAELPEYLSRAFEQPRWIAYSPTGPSPIPSSTEVIEADLKVLKQKGFQGIVTYGCDGLKKEIPRIAKSLGIKFVVVGVWNPKNEEEMTNARDAARFVDAYCVGNEGLGGESRYTLPELHRTIDGLRRWSGKPVTTSEQIEDYFNIPELRELGDWLFPNVHPFWHNKTTEPEASQWTSEQFRKLRAAAPKKFIICKEVGLPTASLDAKTKLPDERSQLDYYRALKKTGTPFVFFEAFDQVWKTHHPAEPFWGIYRSDRSPKLITDEKSPSPIPKASVKINKMDKLDVAKDPESGGLFNVQGTVAGIAENARKLLLLVNPNKRAAPGWFLQIPPNGISDIRPDGTWIATGQIGNRKHPPHVDDPPISILVLALSVSEADRLIEERRNSPVLQNKGILSQDLPQVDEHWKARRQSANSFRDPSEIGIKDAEVDKGVFSWSVETVVCPTPQEAWHFAISSAVPGECICIAGSFYLAAEMRPLIQAAVASAPVAR